MLRPRRAPTRALIEAILRVADGAGDRFDGGPAQQPGALLGDPAAGDVAVGLAVTWGQPGPRTQPPRVGEPGDVADLGDEHGGEHRADPTQRLDRLVAGMTLQPAVDANVAVVDLAVVDLDQVTQRGDAVDVLVTETEIVEPPLPTVPQIESSSGITPSLPRV